MCKTVFEYMVIFSYCFEAQTPAARHPFCHGLIFWDLAIHLRSRPRDLSQPSLQNFIWAVDKVFCISSSWFVPTSTNILLQFLSYHLDPMSTLFKFYCFLYCRSIIYIQSPLLFIRFLFCLFLLLFFFWRFVHCFVSPFISVSFVPHLLHSGATLSVSPHAAVARRGKKRTWSAKLAQLCSTMLNSRFAPLFLRSSVKLLMRNLVFRINHSITSLTCHLSQSWDPSN